MVVNGLQREGQAIEEYANYQLCVLCAFLVFSVVKHPHFPSFLPLPKYRNPSSLFLTTKPTEVYFLANTKCAEKTVKFIP